MEENFSREDKLATGLELEGAARDSIQSIAQWTNINAIIGFISLGVSLLSTYMLFSKMSSYFMSSGAGIISILTSVVSVVLSLILNIALYNFSKQIKLSLDDDSQENFERASYYIRNYFKFYMIMIILIVILTIFSAFMRGGTSVF